MTLVTMVTVYNPDDNSCSLRMLSRHLEIDDKNETKTLSMKTRLFDCAPFFPPEE